MRDVTRVLQAPNEESVKSNIQRNEQSFVIPEEFKFEMKCEDSNYGTEKMEEGYESDLSNFIK